MQKNIIKNSIIEIDVCIDIVFFFILASSFELISHEQNSKRVVIAMVSGHG